MKSRIFIGSSSESKKKAYWVKECMEPEFECVVWTKLFEINNNTYSELYKKSIGFDFAVFIGGKDDKVIRMGDGTEKISPRDNVYIEFGLYAGVLSPARSFFLFDRECKIASDLNGITAKQYKDKAELKERCEELKEKIRKEEKLSRIQYLPSTSLAIGYFENFLKPVSYALSCMEELEMDNKTVPVKKWEKVLEVTIPDNVVQDWKSIGIMFYKERDTREITLAGEPRGVDVHLDYGAFSNENKIRLLDIPQTVRAAFRAVDLVSGKDYEGADEILILAKEKEVDNFVGTLNNLIRTDARVEKYVKIVM